MTSLNLPKILNTFCILLKTITALKHYTFRIRFYFAYILSGDMSSSESNTLLVRYARKIRLGIYFISTCCSGHDLLCTLTIFSWHPCLSVRVFFCKLVLGLGLQLQWLPQGRCKDEEQWKPETWGKREGEREKEAEMKRREGERERGRRTGEEWLKETIRKNNNVLVGREGKSSGSGKESRQEKRVAEEG